MYKNLSNSDVTVTRYQARKRYRLDSESPLLSFHIGANQSEAFDPESSPKNASGTYLKTVYELIRHKYYREDGNPYERFGVADPTKMDRSNFPRGENASIYVLKISSKLFGKRVDKGSFEIKSISEKNTIAATDDGNGNIFSGRENDQIGNIFYSNGVAVLTEPPSSLFELDEEDVNEIIREQEDIDEDEEIPDEDKFPFKKEQNRYTAFPDYERDAFDSLFQDYNLNFRSVTENYEHEISVEIAADEFGSTLNRSARKDSGEPIEALENGDFRPYVTTVGYYNDEAELVATAKLSKPIKLPKSSPMTILTRIDT